MRKILWRTGLVLAFFATVLLQSHVGHADLRESSQCLVCHTPSVGTVVSSPTMTPLRFTQDEIFSDSLSVSPIFSFSSFSSRAPPHS